MGIFAKKPEKSVKSIAPQVLMLPLSTHEAGEVMEVVNALRTGDQAALESGLSSIKAWDPKRSIVALGTLAERYVKYLIDAGVLQPSEAGDSVRGMVAELRGSIAERVRPSEEVMFDALVLATSSSSPNVRRRIEEDPGGALVGLAYLCAAGATLSMQVPGQNRPSLRDMLHGISAPW